MDSLHKIRGISTVAGEPLDFQEGLKVLVMPQAETRAQIIVAFEVFNCVRYTATGNVLSLIKFSDLGRYKKCGPKKTEVLVRILSLRHYHFYQVSS